jgi:hypothetical protein
VSPGSTQTDRSQPTVVLAGIEDAQPNCHLKAFLFELSVAFLATRAFCSQHASKSGAASPEEQKHRENKMTPPEKST